MASVDHFAEYVWEFVREVISSILRETVILSEERAKNLSLGLCKRKILSAAADSSSLRMADKLNFLE